jgi:uracil phosphoribosyltransferase
MIDKFKVYVVAVVIIIASFGILEGVMKSMPLWIQIVVVGLFVTK